MRTQFGWAVLAAMTLSSTMAGAQTAPVALVPADKWNVDFADAACVASRNFTNAGKPEQFAIKMSPHGDTAELFLIRRGQASSAATTGTGSITLGSSGPVREQYATYGLPGTDGGSILQTAVIDRPMIDRLAKVDSVTLGVGVGARIVPLPLIADVMTNLKECAVGLREAWNVDKSVPELITEAQWMLDGDSRPQGLRPGDSWAKSLLLIDEKGKAAACYTERPSGDAGMDLQACVKAAKLTFRAPSDRAGKPIRSAYAFWTTSDIALRQFLETEGSMTRMRGQAVPRQQNGKGSTKGY